MSGTIVLLGKSFRTEKIGECVILSDLKPNNKGRFQVRIDGERYQAHRLVLGIHDPEVYVCHHCDNPWCINPDHLYAGTPQSNMDDKMRRGRYKNGRLLPEWLRNEIFEAEQAYGPTLAAKYLGYKSAYAVGKRRKSFFL